MGQLGIQRKHMFLEVILAKEITNQGILHGIYKEFYPVDLGILSLSISAAWASDIPQMNESPLVASYKGPLVARSLSLSESFWSNLRCTIFVII